LCHLTPAQFSQSLDRLHVLRVLPVFSTMCYPRSDLVRTPVFLYCTIKETDSKVEQGNDNLIACDSNGSSTVGAFFLPSARCT